MKLFSLKLHPSSALTTSENLLWTFHQLSCYHQPQRQNLGWQVGRFVCVCTLKRAIPADHWWCTTQSPSSMGLCSCQISLFSLGNCHRNLTCTAASPRYKNQHKRHLKSQLLRELGRRNNVQRDLMVGCSDKVDWNVYSREQHYLFGTSFT